MAARAFNGHGPLQTPRAQLLALLGFLGVVVLLQSLLATRGGGLGSNAPLSTPAELQSLLHALALKSSKRDPARSEAIMQLAEDVQHAVSVASASAEQLEELSRAQGAAASTMAALAEAKGQLETMTLENGSLQAKLKQAAADRDSAVRDALDADAELAAVEREAAAAKQQLAAAQQQAQAAPASSSQQPLLPGAAPAAATAEPDEAALGAAAAAALAVAGDSCSASAGYEFPASDVAVWGSQHRTPNAGECCAACHALRRTIAAGGTERGANGTSCNTWVHCSDSQACGERHGECWLKWDRAPPSPGQLPASAYQSPGWTSGVVHEPEQQLAALEGAALVMRTSLGNIELALLPELAPRSVQQLRLLGGLLAARGGGCGGGCRIYRPERGFLVQGVIEAPGAYVGVPRHPNPPQRMVMERGLVCWAGGGGGPHWFVNLIDQAGFDDEHLCFAKASEASMAVFDRILDLPIKAKQDPGEMTGLVQELHFNVTLRPQPPAAAATALVLAATTGVPPRQAADASAASAANTGAGSAQPLLAAPGQVSVPGATALPLPGGNIPAAAAEPAEELQQLQQAAAAEGSDAAQGEQQPVGEAGDAATDAAAAAAGGVGARRAALETALAPAAAADWPAAGLTPGPHALRDASEDSSGLSGEAPAQQQGLRAEGEDAQTGEAATDEGPDEGPDEGADEGAAEQGPEQAGAGAAVGVGVAAAVQSSEPQLAQ